MARTFLKQEATPPAVEAKAAADWQQEAAALAGLVAKWREDEPVIRQKLLVIESTFIQLTMSGRDPASEAQELKRQVAERAEEARLAGERLRRLVAGETEKLAHADLIADFIERRQRAREIVQILLEVLEPLAGMEQIDKAETAARNKFVDGLQAKVGGPALPRFAARGISCPSVNLMEHARRDDLLGLLRELLKRLQ